MASPTIPTTFAGTCDSCPYYFAPTGNCRRNPPTVIMVPKANALGNLEPAWMSVYPPTQKHHGCGEHPLNRNLTPVKPAETPEPNAPKRILTM